MARRLVGKPRGQRVGIIAMVGCARLRDGSTHNVHRRVRVFGIRWTYRDHSSLS
jgi:hypothetical protein